MRDPNNTRNRWRRYVETVRAYGWPASPFRAWLRAAGPDSYKSGARNEETRLIACRCKDRRFFCLCK